VIGALPALNARDVLRALAKAGFVQKRVSGSHYILAHRDDPSRMVTVPHHGARDLKRGTVRNIVRQSGFTMQEFRRLL
jgi:predicted RNA binding protein YcfA (HicA-like mRNA interferase family)